LNSRRILRVSARLIRCCVPVGRSLDIQSAELFVFPVDRRAALVRQIAARLSGLHGEAANGFWRASARTLYLELLAQGHDEQTARGEIGRFSDSVQTEMRERARPSLSLVTA
jgi:hypothetical protein